MIRKLKVIGIVLLVWTVAFGICWCIAMESLLSGQYSWALPAWNLVLLLNPLCTEAYSFRAEVNQSYGFYENAISDLNICLRSHPNDPSLYQNRALNYIEIRDFKRAFSDINKAIALAPQKAAYYLVRAKVNERSRNLQDAINDCDTAGKYDQRTIPEACFIRGLAYQRMPDRVKQAIKEYDLCSTDSRLRLPALFNRGWCFKNFETDADCKSALKNFAEVVEELKENGRMLYELSKEDLDDFVVFSELPDRPKTPFPSLSEMSQLKPGTIGYQLKRLNAAHGVPSSPAADYLLVMAFRSRHRVYASLGQDELALKESKEAESYDCP